MPNIHVAVINASTVVKDEDFAKTVAALQIQVSRDFAPVWGIDATLRALSKQEKPTAHEWWLAILDDSDQAGALGYHDLTSTGLPIGKVFAKTDLHYGDAWSVTASHELLEMLADPTINLTVFDESNRGGRLYAYEVCDACEADKFGYKINNILVSDFVFPSWFESFWKPNTTQFCYSNKITKPFQLLKGGYIGIYDINSGNGWTQLTAEKVNHRARPPVGSRRERRSILTSNRIFSTCHSE
ncbi:hypothetical protein BJL95_02150 [Methylomonas sp. LWB]|uniref:hypothetical protein n=1 Tax=Methylomonas sp. LWB TaxID=1905845 RepID=UPI0008D96DBD|nr:hypothetical protein [Methylomonas sp. LWB]OHX36701.1 hypothetical protein BJL95_02150 [Methylomonas sp. LWB]